MTGPAVSAIHTRAVGRLRLVPAPRPGLPYDDDVSAVDSRASSPAATGSAARSQGTQGTLALAFSLPSGLPAVPVPSTRTRIVGRELRSGRRLSVVPEAGVASRPAATRWAALIAQAIVEAEVGDRPLSQLLPWTSPQVYEAVAARCARHAQRTAPARRSTSRALVSSIHVCQLGDDVAEVCATVRWADRARAVALRLDGAGTVWRCTAVSFG